MELIKIFSSFYFIGGIIAASLLVAFLFEDIKKVNIGFVLVTLFLSWWSFGFYFWITADSYNAAGFWVGVASFGATLMPVAFYNWIVFLLEKDRKYLILFGYLISAGFALLSFTGLYYRDLSIVGVSTFWPQAGGMYIFYIIFIYAGFFVLGIYELVNNLLQNKKNPFLQADKNVLLLSILILFLGIFNFPLWYGIDILPLGGLLAIFVNLFLLFYVVLKFKLIDKKSFYAQSLIGAILVINGLDILFSDDLFEVGYKSVMLIFLMLFSNLLIKSYKEDIAQKEDLFRLGKKLEASNKKLKELDRAKNEFISIAAHQLRTPPTVIKGYLNLAKEDPNNKLDEETRDSLSRALASNDRLIELVEDILNISRIESGKMQYEFHANQSIDKILKELVEIFEEKAKERGLKLKLELPKNKLPN
ncbi:MAG: histidine kinase dimerization/phospho-acceptor domain-containing protein, partial [Candidatus Moraniibacteriota bacterium]